METSHLVNPNSYLDYIAKNINSVEIYRGANLAERLENEFVWDLIAEILKIPRFNGGKIVFIGNGGSAAIAGHMALDFSNAGKLRAVCFNDGPLLTCLANDYSYEKSFEKAIEMYADKGDVLVAISSSGESKNILNAVVKAKSMGCFTITLSGFSSENSLIKLGDFNIYVPISRPNYGPVEIAHYFILHFLLDYINKK